MTRKQRHDWRLCIKYPARTYLQGSRPSHLVLISWQRTQVRPKANRLRVDSVALEEEGLSAPLCSCGFLALLDLRCSIYGALVCGALWCVG
jgi:hypothetical protein